MILLIGNTGYMGRAFQRELERLKLPFIGINSSFNISVESLSALIRYRGISFVINAAGYTGKPNVDACELPENLAGTLAGNVILPDVIKRACEANSIPFGHISTGCLYKNGTFSEEDKPNHYSFYSRSKEIAERILADSPCYLWRLRMPFNNIDCQRNYLSKLLRYNTLITEPNSVSHIEDYINACLSLYLGKSPFGAYNITNPGAITPKEVISLMRKYELTDKEYTYVSSDSLPGIIASRSNCILNTDKLKNQGIILPDALEAVELSLRSWIPA